MSEGLVEWLRAQLDEDERVAECIRHGGFTPPTWHVVPDPDGGAFIYAEDRMIGAPVDEPPDRDDEPLAKVTGGRNEAEHIALWDPARVLREVEAKRKILDDFDRCWRTINAYAADEIREVYYDQILPALALPYSDRPGFREEWRADDHRS